MFVQRTIRAVCSLLAIVSLVGLAAQKVPAADRVEFETADGVTICGSFLAPSKAKSPMPGVLLLHQLGRDRASWNAFAAKLAERQYAVLAIDLRGHGESVNFGEEIRRYPSFEEKDWLAMIEDVRAAASFLKSRREVNGDRIAVVGASIGANLAFAYAAEDRQVRTAVLLSPGENYHGLLLLPYVEGYDKRSLFVGVSEKDEYSYASSERLVSAAKLTEPLKLKVYPGSRHGTDLFLAHSGLDAIIIAWLENNLPNG